MHNNPAQPRVSISQPRVFVFQPCVFQLQPRGFLEPAPRNSVMSEPVGVDVGWVGMAGEMHGGTSGAFGEQMMVGAQEQ